MCQIFLKSTTVDIELITNEWFWKTERIFMNILCRFFFVAIFLLPITHIYSWWDTGHMVVAQIAYSELNDDVKMKVDRLICAMDQDFLESNTFVTASCWLDDIKHRGFKMFDSYHISNSIYDARSIFAKEPHDLVTRNQKYQDIVWALNHSEGILMSKLSGTWEKALALRILLHCIGDIHQPLHVTSFHNEYFTRGDSGGCDFMIVQENGKTMSLHAFWDSILGKDAIRIPRPFDTMGAARIESFAKELTSLFPEESLPEIAVDCFGCWKEESYNLAVDFVYDGIEPNGKVSKEYIEKGREVAYRQLALAGYRLKYLLNTLFSNDEQALR